MKIEKKILYLDIGLRILGITFDRRTHHKIILLMGLIDKRKGRITLKDVLKINDKI